MRFLEAAVATACLLIAGKAFWSIKQESNEVPGGSGGNCLPAEGGQGVLVYQAGVK